MCSLRTFSTSNRLPSQIQIAILSTIDSKSTPTRSFERRRRRRRFQSPDDRLPRQSRRSNDSRETFERPSTSHSRQRTTGSSRGHRFASRSSSDVEETTRRGSKNERRFVVERKTDALVAKMASAVAAANASQSGCTETEDFTQAARETAHDVRIEQRRFECYVVGGESGSDAAD